MESFLGQSNSWLGLMGSLGAILIGHVAQKYLIPFLKIGRREQYARHIAIIADDITDDLKMKYPDKSWLAHLDEGIDSLISICEISPETARRAINASISRK